MEIIFNKHNNGSEELKKILGFINADFRFVNLETDITHSTYDLVKIIGEETYNVIRESYEEELSDEATDKQKATNSLVRLVQTPIAAFALLSYEANNDITHGSNGRFSDLAEGQKMAFEHTLNRDEKHQRKRAYKSIDVLLNALDSADLDEWKNSNAYKDSKSYFISSVADFSKVIKTFDSYHLLLKMQTFMGQIEKNTIRPLIGIDLYNSLKTLLVNKATEVDSDLLELVNAPIAYKALHDAYQILPKELFDDILETSGDTAKISMFLNQKYTEHLTNLTNYISELNTGSSFEDPMPINDPNNNYFTV